MPSPVLGRIPRKKLSSFVRAKKEYKFEDEGGYVIDSNTLRIEVLCFLEVWIIADIVNVNIKTRVQSVKTGKIAEHTEKVLMIFRILTA